jgi:hypothetical protein
LKSFSNKKIMIYDVLKSKHQQHARQEKLAIEGPQVT